MKIKVSPSLMCADLLHLAEELAALEEAGADMLHLDVMDGHFVPNFVFGEDMVKAVRKGTGLPLDVHLAVDRPKRFIERFVQAGADIITIHTEACEDIAGVIEAIRSSGARPCVAVKADTGIDELEEVLPRVSMVDVMGIRSAFAGQQLSPATTDRIKALRKMAGRLHQALDIEIDGGVNRDTVTSVVAAGANVVILGRQMLFHEERNRYKEVIEFLKGLQCD
jgi:ribulose-phosphate 3-epimerase